MGERGPTQAGSPLNVWLPLGTITTTTHTTHTGRTITEGIVALSSAMLKTLSLQYLYISRNYLLDEHIQLIGNAIENMPQFLDLGMAGNICKLYGCRAMKLALASHGVSVRAMMGFRSLDLSNNPLGDDGIKELCFAIVRSNTLQALQLYCCGMTDVGGKALQDAMANNATVVVLDIRNNPMSAEQEAFTAAEAEANQLIKDINADPHAVNADALTREVSNPRDPAFHPAPAPRATPALLC